MQVNIHEAKTNFSKILQKVACGEEVVIAKAGKPIAKILPYGPVQTKRKPGSAKGKIKLNGFDAPLPKDFLAAFE